MPTTALYRFPDEIWTATVEGCTLVLQSRRRTEKILPSPEDARRAADKAIRKKLLEGFVVRAADGTVAEAVAPQGQTAALDISPDGAHILTGGMGRSAYGAWIATLDRRTGAWTRWLDIPAEHHQTFLHQLCFTADQRILYLLNSDLFRLDAPHATPVLLSSWREGEDGFNPFCVQPQVSADRTRLLTLVSPRALQVQALADGAILFSRPDPSPTREVRRIALSPSGRTVAFFHASRYHIHGHDDARHDNTDEVCVYDVDSGARRLTLPILPDPSQSSGDRVIDLATTDDTLIVTRCYGRDVLRVALDSGEQQPLLPTAQDPLSRSVSGAVWSPDGRELAVLSYGPEIYSADGRLLYTEERNGRGWMARYSADGRWLALAWGGDILVRERPQ